ncbi:uncharacterized protein si:dkey-187a12.4 [Astyanax mexicanus]|uniref:uncharacterized protein si:dkey-187a12.4 n=1 Tax=Astyanax mexicanus TaxID=7994 RepID=UPI0020CAC9CE|nr:uncharacterized protein si:dkey-187a12.4 [Astyanax mexicanus]
METNNGNGSNWAIQRRVEGLVNKHMADMALETLQQRLSAVSEEINHLTDDRSRREDAPKAAEEAPRRTETNFRSESSYPPAAAAGARAGEKLMLNTPSSSSLSSSSSSSSPAAAAAQSSETAAQRKIISLLLEIKEEQQRQWAVLKDLQARVQGQVWEEEVEALDVDLPVRTMEQLDEMEKHLEDTGAQQKMVSHLSRMGGATVDDAVRRLMQAVLSFAVGSELNWVGRGQKRSFRNTRLQGVLFRALKRTPVGKEATHHQFADVVKKWLRFAPYRQGGSGRRQHYKPPVEFMCTKYPDTEG